MSALVLQGDAMTLPLPDVSVDLVVTSPPYFGLRSYTDGGAHLTDQVGGEATPAEFVNALIVATAEMMRVLKPSGSIWVNLGDKYSGAQQQTSGKQSTMSSADYWKRTNPAVTGVKSKSLYGIPWRYALRCVDELGLILRRDLIWSKPNGLPESVTDRCRSSHEYWFHFVKQPRYFSAIDEIRETFSGPLKSPGSGMPGKAIGPQDRGGASQWERTRDERDATVRHPLGKLPGSVWTIATQPLKVPEWLGVDHFAAFPMEWPRRLILGWSPSGICTVCGEGRRPVTAAVGLNFDRPQARRAHELAVTAGLTEAHFAALLSVGVSDVGRGKATQTGTGKNTTEVYELADEASAALGGYAREYLLRRPTGFRYACRCPDVSAPITPAVILDPFGGTGTTATVATALNRVGITVDMSYDYCRVAGWRTTDAAQLAKAANARPPTKPRRLKPVPPAQLRLFEDGAA